MPLFDLPRWSPMPPNAPPVINGDLRSVFFLFGSRRFDFVILRPPSSSLFLGGHPKRRSRTSAQKSGTASWGRGGYPRIIIFFLLPDRDSVYDVLFSSLPYLWLRSPDAKKVIRFQTDRRPRSKKCNNAEILASDGTREGDHDFHFVCKIKFMLTCI